MSFPTMIQFNQQLTFTTRQVLYLLINNQLYTYYYTQGLQDAWTIIRSEGFAKQSKVSQQHASKGKIQKKAITL